jgi:hypothetical protein
MWNAIVDRDVSVMTPWNARQARTPTLDDQGVSGFMSMTTTAVVDHGR